MESLTLEQAYYIGELVGLVVVIISLLYLAIQVKQNIYMMKIQANQEYSEQWSRIASDLKNDPELSEIWMRGLNDYDSMNKIDKFRFTMPVTDATRIWEMMYFRFMDHTLEPELWEAMLRLQMDYFSTQGVRSLWETRKRYFNDSYQKYVDSNILNQGGSYPVGWLDKNEGT